MADRYYEVNGEKYPSVTTITGQVDKPALRFWYAKHGIEGAKELSQEAKETGDTVHKCIEKAIVREPYQTEESSDAENCMKNFEIFTNEFKIAPVFLERIVFSNTNKYAGTLDALLEIKGKLVVVDWKTSSGIWDEYKMQVVAYGMALSEMGILDRPLDGAWIVRLDKEKEFKAKRDIYKVGRKETDYFFNAFLGLLQYFKSMEEVNKYKKRRKKPSVSKNKT